MALCGDELGDAVGNLLHHRPRHAILWNVIVRSGRLTHRKTCWYLGPVVSPSQRAATRQDSLPAPPRPRLNCSRVPSSRRDDFHVAERPLLTDI
jgi:hypothetical protein